MMMLLFLYTFCLVNAETGSGKTAAFALPILEKLSQDPIGIFAIVVTPNRELALQITEHFCIFGASINLRCTSLIGGVDMLPQASEIKQIPHVVVGTPGRMAAMLEREDLGTAKLLKHVKFVVLDEVDRLLEPTLEAPLLRLLSLLPEKRVTVFATATFDESDVTVEKLKKFLPESPLPNEKSQRFDVIKANRLLQVVSTVTQQYIFIPNIAKDTYLFHLIKNFDGLSAVIFVNKCKYHPLWLPSPLNEPISSQIENARS